MRRPNEEDKGGGSLHPSKNLDALKTAQESLIQASQRSEGDLAPAALFSVRACSRRLRRGSSRHLSIDHAINMDEAVHHAARINLPLAAHATIHWVGTDSGDDPDGKRFAKVREGLDKYLLRRGITGGLTAVWCRECRAHTDVVHCHLLFHLPPEFCSGANLLQIEAALNRLVSRHGNGLWGEFAVKLTIHRDPDGLYLLKGGNRDVWREFNIKKQWRERAPK